MREEKGKVDESVLTNYVSLMEFLWRRSYRTINPNPLKVAFDKRCPTFKAMEQHDTIEFFVGFKLDCWCRCVSWKCWMMILRMRMESKKKEIFQQLLMSCGWKSNQFTQILFLTICMDFCVRLNIVILVVSFLDIELMNMTESSITVSIVWRFPFHVQMTM